MGKLPKSQVLVYGSKKKCNMWENILVLIIMDNRRMNLKFIKIAILFTITLLGTNNAFAGPDGSPFEGLYVGISTAKSTFASTAIFEEVPKDDFPSIFNGIDSSSSSNSYGAGFFGGYGLNYGLFYFGAEAGFLVDKGSTTYSDGVNTIKLSQSNTFEMATRVGMTISDKALIYGLIGYTGVSLKSKGVNDHGNDNRTYNTRVTGIRYGAGAEVSIMENIALRAEYTRTKIGDAYYPDGADEFTFKPETSRIMLSLVLHMY